LKVTCAHADGMEPFRVSEEPTEGRGEVDPVHGGGEVPRQRQGFDPPAHRRPQRRRVLGPLPWLPVGRVAEGAPMLRLKKWQIRSSCQSSVDRNLAQAMSGLDRLTDRLHVPRAVKEQAAVIYRRALKEGLVRGRSILTMVAASLYAALRVTRTPMTLSEIARVSTIDEKDISRSYRILIRELGLHMPVQRAQLNVPKIASKVEVGEEAQRRAIEILGEADRLKITIGKDPMGLAASALYMACIINEENRTQKVLAEAADVTEVTIRNRYTELKRVLNLDRFKPERG